jgi:hypothetical protein
MPSEHHRWAVETFAHELRLFRDEYGRPTLKEIEAAAESLRDGGVYLTISHGWLSDVLNAKSELPPNEDFVVAFGRAVLHLAEPGEPATADHPRVRELLRARKRLLSDAEFGVFRRHLLDAALAEIDEVAGCLAVHDFVGATIHIGGGAGLAEAVRTLFPEDGDIPRGAAELEIWPMPDRAPDDVARAEEALVLRALQQSAPRAGDVALPERTEAELAALPPSLRYPLVDPAAVLEARLAVRDRARAAAELAETRYTRALSLFKPGHPG